MYRQQYKDSFYTDPYLEEAECFQPEGNDDTNDNIANPKNKVKSHSEWGEGENHNHHYSQFKKEGQDIDDNYNDIHANNNNLELERESEQGESININEIRISTGELFEDGDSDGDEDKSLNRYSHHQNRNQPPTIGEGEQSPEEESVPPFHQRGYTGEEGGNDINRNYTSHTNTSLNRRISNSLNSLPSSSHFYPDPYSIVFSRYLEDLGSLSPYSSATGSEATEYLPLSRTGSPLSTPGIEDPSRREERKRRESGLLFSASSKSSEEVLDDNMNFDSALSTSEEYQSFRSSVPLRKICVEADGSKEWKVYDAGPRTVRTPLLCIGPACSTADVFFRQILNLTARGIRVISVEGPVYWSTDDWCKGLKKLLDCLNLDKVHIFGASLGGFLAQKFAEYTYHYSRVASLMLCNTFLDTSIFDYHDSAMIFWMLPSVILKKLIIENITAARIMDLDIAHAIEFMIERLNNLSQQELASRMTLNCVNGHVDTFKLKQIKMTIMDVFDESALSNQAREDLYRNYTDAKLAHLKSGGNFPYLSRSDEVNMHIMVHLRAFNDTKHSAQLQETPGSAKAESDQSPTRPIPSRQSNGSSASNKIPEDVFGSTEPNQFPASSFEDKAYKEEAATALGLPVQ